jgi:4-amino-4-deoxy-L-arabinose transferase-like glycosyltransferase
MKKIIVLSLLFCLILVSFYSPFEERSSLPLTDSVEYAVIGSEIASNGLFTFELNDNRYPSRYYPWFSLFWIVPSYALFGNSISNAALLPIFFSMLGFLIAFRIGRLITKAINSSIDSFTPAIFGTLSLFLVPSYFYFGRQVLTDVICTILFLACAYNFMLVADTIVTCAKPLCLFKKKEEKFIYSLFLETGIFAGIGILLKPTCIFFLLPFCCITLLNRDYIFGTKKQIEAVSRSFLPKIHSLQCKFLFSLLFPSTLFLFFSLIYNKVVFFDFFRSGYHYWVSVPYDYVNLTFSIHYLDDFLHLLIDPFGPLGVGFLFCTLYIFYRKSPHLFPLNQHLFKAILFYALFSCIPLIIFYSLYFYKTSRFLIPIHSLLAVLSGILIGSALEQYWKDKKNLLFSLQCGTILLLIFTQVGRSYQTQNHKDFKNHLSDEGIVNGNIVSILNPLYLEYNLKEYHLHYKVIPKNRSVEYASKVVTPYKILNPEPYPVNFNDNRCSGLLKGGAREVYINTAYE